MKKKRMAQKHAQKAKQLSKEENPELSQLMKDINEMDTSN